MLLCGTGEGRGGTRWPFGAYPWRRGLCIFSGSGRHNLDSGGWLARRPAPGSVGLFGLRVCPVQKKGVVGRRMLGRGS